jgi:large subunit ribosomal protein L28
MANRCDICGKGPQYGHSVSHSNIHTKRVWKPNLQQIRIRLENGTPRRVRICTGCLSANKVIKAY